jgi:hypothetical protein
MPRYIIERQYLLPVYQHLVVEAPDLVAACRAALDDDNWESGVSRDPPKQDYDSARPTEITRIVELPARLWRNRRARRGLLRTAGARRAQRISRGHDMNRTTWRIVWAIVVLIAVIGYLRGIGTIP